MVLCFVVHPRFLEHCVDSCLHLRCLSKGLREGSLSFFPCTASMFLVLCWLSTVLLLVSALVCDLGGNLVGSLTCSSVPFSVWCDVFDFRCFFWFTCIRFRPKFLFFFFQVMKKVDQALVIYCMLWLFFLYFSGLYAQVLPNMLCKWLRLKKNESRCHQNNLWTNHFVTLQVSPRLAKDRERFPPNNILFMLFGTRLLWMSWTCFNGGDPCVVSTDASLAVLNSVDWECFQDSSSVSHSIHRKISECLNSYIRMQILLQRLWSR